MIEMNRNNIRIDPMLEVDTNWNPPCIVAYIELWFDVDEKFGTHTRDRDDAVCPVQPCVQQHSARVLH